MFLKPEPASFYPPRTNPHWISFAQWLAPFVSRWHYKFKLQVDSDSVDRLQALKHQRMILLPNHPTFHDPPVIFALSGHLKMTFQYLCAIDIMQTRLGAILQRLGVYSIRRGIADRASIAQTLEILANPACKLVIFAEGGCSFQNDTVIPFRTGAIQMAFQTLNKFHKQGEALPDLYAVPISLKYRYTQDMYPVIEQTLTKLEQTLDLTPTGDLYHRLKTLAETVLDRHEQTYQMQPKSEWTWNQRIATLKQKILQICEQQLGLVSAPEDYDRERTYRIQTALIAMANPQALEGKSHSHIGEWTPSDLSRAAKLVLNYDAVYDSYVSENPTPERFLDMLVRFERDLLDLDSPPPKGHRQAHIQVAEPINLKDWFDLYHVDRVQTVATITQQLQDTVQDQLAKL
jgi:1-acyl-sn-glycerol-3-phosphate acyltransferase